MVALPRAAGGADRLRALRRPRPIAVRMREGRPAAVKSGRNSVAVAAILEHWRLDDEWWRERPQVRWYYRLALEDGRTITLFHDRIADAWFEQEYSRRP